MLDHGPGIGLEARHSTAEMGVNFDDFFHRGGFEEGGGHAFLDADYDTLACGDLGGMLAWDGSRWETARWKAYSDGGGAEFDGFEGVFDLEETAFGGECALWWGTGVSEC